MAVSASGIEQALAASIPRLARRRPSPSACSTPTAGSLGYEPDLSDAELTALYGWMVFGRQLDERGMQLQRQGRLGVWGPMIGQEAAAGRARAWRMQRRRLGLSLVSRSDRR